MKRIISATPLRFGSRGKTIVVDSEKSVEPVIERPTSIDVAGDGPIPLDFTPGEGTDIIDHQMDVSEKFYKPGIPVPLEAVLQHEAKREHLHIYRANPDREIQTWENGMPRFVRAPMHMIHDNLDSKDSELPLGPVLHDTRTGIAIRILGHMVPSPEMKVRESQVRSKMTLWSMRYLLWGFTFAMAFLLKFMSYMALRTKLRTQGISNPILPGNRIKTLEIIKFARADFAQYKTLFSEFKETQWIPYRQACLRADNTVSEQAATEIADIQKGISVAERKAMNKKWYDPRTWFGGNDEKESTIQSVHIPQLNKTFEIDTSRHILGLTPDGPVYAPPDVEVFKPDDLEKKMKKLKSKIVTQMDEETKQWAADSYDKRGRDHADEFIVKFHGFLKQKGAITQISPEEVEKMYELQPIPRVQFLEDHEGGASESELGRPRVVRTR